jgi:Arc/MetJ-type ribon-helix-helix transcriptional regulator
LTRTIPRWPRYDDIFQVGENDDEVPSDYGASTRACQSGTSGMAMSGLRYERWSTSVRNIGMTKMAAKAIKPKKRSRGRPATGKDTLVGVRLPPQLIKQIDTWAKRKGVSSRSEAIRRLVDQSLVAAAQQPLRGRHKGASKASEWAGEEVDRRVDQSLPTEERERRKQQLTKGPNEFRDIRGNFPKPKA